jgi:glucose-6-phosphate dehydrogenase assembly protein OpcA
VGANNCGCIQFVELACCMKAHRVGGCCGRQGRKDGCVGCCMFINTHRGRLLVRAGGVVGQQQQGGARTAVQAHAANAGVRDQVGANNCGCIQFVELACCMKAHRVGGCCGRQGRKDGCVGCCMFINTHRGRLLVRAGGVVGQQQQGGARTAVQAHAANAGLCDKVGVC